MASLSMPTKIFDCNRDLFPDPKTNDPDPEKGPLTATVSLGSPTTLLYPNTPALSPYSLFTVPYATEYSPETL